jgi:hypothetical protein
LQCKCQSGAEFPSKDKQANPNTNIQFLPEQKTDSLLMYYIHSIPKALTDTQLEFCAGNPQHGYVATRQYTNGGFALQIRCRNQVFIPNKTTFKTLQPFQLAIDNYFSEISMVGY